MKGQAAIEYLSTYGFAILVIVIVLAVLMNLFSSIGRPEICTVKPSGFSCGDVNPIAYVDANNNLYVTFRFSNNQQSEIKLGKIVCLLSNNEASPNGIGTDKFKDQTIPPGSSLDISNVTCYTTDGSVAKSSEGQDVSLSVLVRYKFINDIPGAPERLAVVKIGTKVVKGTTSENH